MVNFIEGYKSNNGYEEVHYDSNDGFQKKKVWVDKPDTAFITASGQGFKVTIQKLPRDPVEHMTAPEHRDVARVKIQGNVADQIFRDLNFLPQRDLIKKENGSLKTVKVKSFSQKHVENVSNVLANACHFDESAKARLSSFMHTAHQERLVKSQKRQLQAELEELLQEVPTDPYLSKGSRLLIKDLAAKEPTEQRNGFIKRVMRYNYDPIIIENLARDLKEAGYQDLIEYAYEDRYNGDFNDCFEKIAMGAIFNVLEKNSHKSDITMEEFSKAVDEETKEIETAMNIELSQMLSAAFEKTGNKSHASALEKVQERMDFLNVKK